MSVADLVFVKMVDVTILRVATDANVTQAMTVVKMAKLASVRPLSFNSEQTFMNHFPFRINLIFK